jgi:hypothetical protein
VKLELKDLKARLGQSGLKVSKDLLGLVAYLVQMEPRALKDLQEQLDHRVQQDLKVFKGKLAPEVRLVRKAIEASLVLQALLAQQDLKELEEPQEPLAHRDRRESRASVEQMAPRESRVTEDFRG